MAKTDIFRRFLVGVAPFFVGTVGILTLIFFAAKHSYFDNIYILAKHSYFDNIYILLLIGYVVFEIGNTMFSSKKDLEGAVQLFVILIVLFGIVYYFGISLLSFDFNVLFSNPLILQTLQKACFFLLLPIGIDFSIIALLKLFRG